MTSDHTPAHGPRNLATRTVVAVVATLALALAVAVAALGLPSGLVRAFQGPVPALTALEVLPLEPDRVLVCMGPAIAFSGQDSSPVGYGEPTDVAVGSAVETSRIAQSDLQDAFSLENAVVPTPPTILTQPAEAGLLAGASYQQLDNINVRGLALQECQEARAETWLVGGDTTTGRQGVLSLSNPGAVPATVDVDLWGQGGPISSPLGQGILVQPGAQRVITLAGLAPNEARPVLRVTSSGTGIVAALHTSIVRGLDADGLSVITGQAPPSEVRVIPGLYGPPSEIIGPIRGKEGFTDVGGALRVLSPDGPASVTITVVRPGQSDITTTLELEGGQVGDLSLDELGSGDYGLVLESSAPIVAGVRNSVGTDARTDTSWVGSSYAIEGDTVIAVPAIGEIRLSVVNPGQTDVQISLDGSSSTVPAGGILARPLSGGTSSLSSDGPVYAVLSFRGDSVIGNLQVLPAPKPQDPVAMTVR
jgi:hypothetical protein